MDTVHNTIDKFGRRRRQKLTTRRHSCVGFKLSPDGSYDLQNKRLSNVEEPSGETDVVTRSYIDRIFNATIYNIQLMYREPLENLRISVKNSELDSVKKFNDLTHLISELTLKIEDINKQIEKLDEKGRLIKVVDLSFK